MLLRVNHRLEIEIEESATRAGGAGGQHVNTTDSAVILRFDVVRAPLPDSVKYRLADIAGSRMTGEGVIILRAEGSRSQHDNRAEARARLVEMVNQALVVPKRRRPTKPTKGSQKRRVEGKKARADIKAGRSKPRE